MDPELRKLLIAAHAAGASDDDLGKLVDRWQADHSQPGADIPAPQFRPGDAPQPPQDISAQLQSQYDARQRQATLAGMVPMPTYAQVGQNILHLPQRIGRQLALETVNAAQGIPGAKGVLAKVRSVSRNEPYAQAYQDVGALSNELPQTDRVIGKLIGGSALLPLLPANPAVAGAVLGGADQALSGQPGLTTGQRAFNTAVGAGVGGIAGKALGSLGTAAQASAAPTVGRSVLDLRAASKATDAINYPAAFEAAAPREPTPAIRTLFNDPNFDAIATALEKQPQWQGVDRTDPEFLGEIYKSLTDKGLSMDKGLVVFEPSQPNTKQATKEGVRLLKGKLLAAMEAPGEKPPITFDMPAETHSVAPKVIVPSREPQTGPIPRGTAGRAMGDQAQVAMDANGRAVAVSPRDVQGPAGPAFMLRGQPGKVQPGADIETPAMRVQTAPGVPLAPYMPEYRPAVQAHAENEGLFKAFKLGYKGLKANAGKGVSIEQADKLSPEAIDAWLPTATPAQRQQFANGVLARLKQEPQRTKLIFPSKALTTASQFSRAAGTPTQTWADFLSTLGLTSANASGGPP